MSCVESQCCWHHFMISPRAVHAFSPGLPRSPRILSSIERTMLLLLLFVHALSRNANIAQGSPVHSLAPVDFCDAMSNSRSLFNIVWGCLTTLFACTWISVHPNVPPPLESRLVRLGRRLKMMLIAIVAPEIMVGFAARQFLAARKFSKGMSFGSYIALTDST
jgi:hypothetical protein